MRNIIVESIILKKKGKNQNNYATLYMYEKL